MKNVVKRWTIGAAGLVMMLSSRGNIDFGNSLENFVLGSVSQAVAERAFPARSKWCAAVSHQKEI